MKETRIRQLEQTNRQQREIIENLEKMNLETKMSSYEIFIQLSKIGHSEDTMKNIKMMDIVDETIKELFEELKEDIFIPNDEKILELPITRKSIR